MRKLIAYIQDVLGVEIEAHLLSKAIRGKLPLYLNEGYKWHKAMLAGRSCILAEIKEGNVFGIAQIKKHFEQAKMILGLPVIGVFDTLEAYNRKRLIEKRIAFIVPYKQLYVPEFIIDLKEYGTTGKKEQSKLSPIAQQLLLLFILDKQQKKQLENKTYKELAVVLDTNPMGITRAVQNLKYLELTEVTGNKEKFIHFRLERHELWTDAMKRNLLINPVMKRVYVDEKPEGVLMLQSNATALPEYSNMNPSRQEYYAIGKNVFYGLQKSNFLVNANEYEGHYCLEVWKYDPNTLVGELHNDAPLVDPLSLYLSLKDNPDERIEMALEQIMENFIW